jgi:DNA-binding transcriptional LysR family regulator
MAYSVSQWEHRIGRRIRLRDLHILSTVVQWGSMAKAAEHLRMTQPSVSDAIATLEDALQVRLLDRSPRGIEPTIYADALLKRGDVVFDELRQGVRDIEFLSDAEQGEARVGCPESLTAGIVPAIIDRMSRQHPKVIVRVVHADTATFEFPELRGRSIDLMLGKITEPLIDDELDVEVLFEENYVVVAGLQSPWARRRKIDLADLVSEHWIHMPPNNQINSYLAEAFRARGLEAPRESVSAFSMHLRADLLATGRYLTMMPASLLAFNAKRWSSLKVLPVQLGMRPRRCVVITLKNRTLSPVVQRFIEHTRAVAKLVNKDLARAAPPNAMPITVARATQGRT